MLTGTASANCIEVIPFGSPVLAIKGKVEAVIPLKESSVRADIFIPAEAFCFGNELSILQGASLIYQFLFNKLVQINIYLLSDTPTLIKWAESAYGEAVKTKDFYSKPKAVKLIWDRPGRRVIYSLQPGKGEVAEYLTVKSLRHDDLIEKYQKDHEEFPEGGGGPVMR